MTTETPRLGLNRWGIGDSFSLAELNANWGYLDGAPGISSEEVWRLVDEDMTGFDADIPWDASQTDQYIYFHPGIVPFFVRWNGTETEEACGQGFLQRYYWDPLTQGSGMSTSSISYVDVPLPTWQGLPTGGFGFGTSRPQLVTVDFPSLYNTNGVFQVRLGGTMREFTVEGSVPDVPHSLVSVIDPAEGFDLFNVALEIRSHPSYGGDTILGADPVGPSLTVVEL